MAGGSGESWFEVTLDTTPPDLTWAPPRVSGGDLVEVPFQISPDGIVEDARMVLGPVTVAMTHVGGVLRAVAPHPMPSDTGYIEVDVVDDVLNRATRVQHLRVTMIPTLVEPLTAVVERVMTRAAIATNHAWATLTRIVSRAFIEKRDSDSEDQ